MHQSRATSAVQRLQPGARVGQHLLKKELVADCGRLFLVEHVVLGYRAVLKLLVGVAPERAYREVACLSQVNSSHVPQLLDFGELPDELDSTPYLIMDYVCGTSLAQVLKNYRRLEPLRTVRIALQVLATLDAAHRAGFAHGTLGLDEVRLASPGGGLDHVTLLGLGRALPVVTGTDSSGTRLLAQRHYIAPEVVLGQAVGVKADVFAVGSLLYECLSGRRPDVDTQAEAPPLSAQLPVCPQMSSIVARALARDPGQRFESAAHFYEALLRLEPEELAAFGSTERAAWTKTQSVDTLRLDEDRKEPPSEALASLPWYGDWARLHSTQPGEIWVLTGDAAIATPALNEALELLPDHYPVARLDSAERARKRLEFMSGEALPALIIMGEQQIREREPLLGEIARQAETSFALVTEQPTMQLLKAALEHCPVHTQISLPGATSGIARELWQLLQRSERMQRGYDTLRLALSDAQDDLHDLECVVAG